MIGGGFDSLGVAEEWFKGLNTKSYLAGVENESIHDLTHNRKRILDRNLEGKEVTGIKLPWTNTHDRIRLREGDISVWAGYNGHNKSTLLTQTAVWAAQDIKVGVASFEMDLEDTACLMAQQCGGVGNPTTQWVNDFISWAENSIYIWDRLDTVPTNLVLSAVQYFAQELGCKLIIIDSFMMCGIGSELSDEKDFVHTLTALAKSLKVHIAVAHHMRKPQDESAIPGKYDLKGTGGISDLAQQVFICFHDKKLKYIKQKVQNGQPLTDGERIKLAEDRPDQLLIAAKQRHLPFEGAIGLWQNESRQFTTNQKQMLIEVPRL